jgi:hypothetical protein
MNAQVRSETSRSSGIILCMVVHLTYPVNCRQSTGIAQYLVYFSADLVGM